MKYHDVNIHGELEVLLLTFLTSALDVMSDHLKSLTAVFLGYKLRVPTGYESGWAPEAVCFRCP
jgi:hypothetical protein